MSKKFTCPRRIAEGHASPDSPLRLDGPNKDEWRKDRTCSYDGSLHPDDFMEYVRNGGKVGLTDKSYKFYLDQHATAIKFYTHHLSPEQGWELDRLWKDGEINWGYPGRPYVALYIPGPSDQAKNGPSHG